MKSIIWDWSNTTNNWHTILSLYRYISISFHRCSCQIYNTCVLTTHTHTYEQWKSIWSLNHRNLRSDVSYFGLSGMLVVQIHALWVMPTRHIQSHKINPSNANRLQSISQITVRVSRWIQRCKSRHGPSSRRTKMTAGRHGHTATGEAVSMFARYQWTCMCMCICVCCVWWMWNDSPKRRDQTHW